MKTVIFGGSGYLGQHLIKRLKAPVLVVARNEGKLIELKQKFPWIGIQTGDIADRWTVYKAMQGAERVFVLSASKHVGQAEIDVQACCKTNVLGMINILEESYIQKPQELVFISTDKAAQVSGVYGASKLLGERLMLEAERMNPKTKYRTVRYGNVLDSTGSISCKWRELLKQGKQVTVTDPNATRFFWTADEAVEHIFECLEKAKDATPYVPQMKSMQIGDLLVAMYKKYGKGELDVNVIGLQAGENQHETMDGKVFSNEVEQFSVEEIMQKI